MLHVEAGWMPAHIRIDDLEAAVRAVCEPYFTRPLSEISLAEVLVKLFRIAQRYELTMQPQLILLQKTLLNIEGVGRLLDPTLDIWAVAQPVLDEHPAREATARRRCPEELRKRLPEIVRQAPDMPRLVHGYLERAVRGEQALVMRSDDLHRLAETTARSQRRVVWAVLGAGLVVGGCLLLGLGAPGPHWGPVPWLTLGLAAAGTGAFALALRR